MKIRDSGFSLVELMVALLIGLLIILGAGQLFLLSIKNFKQVELLSNKQAALTFVADMVLRDVRRASEVLTPEFSVGASPSLSVRFEAVDGEDGCSAGDVVERTYALSDDEVGDEGWALLLQQTCDGASGTSEPLVSGFAEGGLEFTQVSLGGAVYAVKLCLLDEPGASGCANNIEFTVVNRIGILDPGS